MNRKNIVIKIILNITLVVLIFCIVPTVQAGNPPFIQELDFENNLALPWFFNDYSWEFDSNENLHFRIGAARSIEEIENDWWPNLPWKYRLFINDEEIKLQRYANPGDKDFIHPPVSFFWYHIFGPGYFSPDEEYLLRFEFWVKGPYQGDGLNEWRIFVDYWGIYFPAGTEWSFEYQLNIN